MSNKLVLKTLQTATLAAIAASDTPDLPVKMKGRTFEIPNDQKYLVVVFIPNNQSDRCWGEEQVYQGIFRLVLHWPVDDKGVYDPIDIVDFENSGSVASYFTKTNALRTGGFGVNITQVPKLTGVIEAGHESLFPVSMSYRSFNP